MKRVIVLMSLILGLAACGVDGEPQAPTPEPGLTVSGTVEMGISGSY